MPEVLNTHSPLGASGASRWMVCPGSVSLGQELKDEQGDTYSSLGIAAHGLAANCLHTGQDAWGSIGDCINGVDVDKDMADAVQVYLDFLRPCMNEHGSFLWIEQRFHCPSIHEFFYGTVDHADFWDKTRILNVNDYKHGAGIVVEAQWNPQCLYYACGIMELYDLWNKVDLITVGIIQPRAFHPDGPIRRWSISTEELKDWLWSTLVPAMNRALTSTDTKSGEHCRFCPVIRRACPQVIKDMEELEAIMKIITNTAAELSNEQVGRFLDLLQIAKMVGKAAEETAFSRLNAGQSVPGYKLASARANRIWKDKAEEELKKVFGDKAYETKLKSPAQIEALPLGKAEATKWAFKPEAGLVVVKSEDLRQGVNKDVKSMFQDTTKQRRKSK